MALHRLQVKLLQWCKVPMVAPIKHDAFDVVEASCVGGDGHEFGPPHYGSIENHFFERSVWWLGLGNGE